MGRKSNEPAEKTEWKIAAYMRLSREDGNEESESVINQKKILNEYIEQNFESTQYKEYYTDDGISGTDDTRADFMRMIQDIEKGRINCVICKTLSRAFRNYSDQGYYLEYYFPQKNVRFISIGDPKIDTYLNPEVISGMEVPITGLMNDRYAAKISNDIRRTFDTKRRNGEFIGAFAPYGYLKDPKNKNRLIIDEEILPVKREIFKWIIEGLSLNGIAKRLNEFNIPNPTAYKRSKGLKYHNPKANQNDGLWSGGTVRKMMLDKVNLGHTVQGKQRVISYKVHDRVNVSKEEWIIKENTHEATFTKEEYDLMEKLLKRDTRTPNKKSRVHLFGGFLKCSECNKALQRKCAKGIGYYSCRTYNEKSKSKCTKHSIRADALESAVLASIQAQVALVDCMGKIINDINNKTDNSQLKQIEKMITEREKETEKFKQLSDGLYIDLKSGIISREEYFRMKKMFSEQITRTQNALQCLLEEQSSINQKADTNNNFKNILKYKNITQLDRGLLAELVDIIYVHENKEITIKFSFQDEVERILKDFWLRINNRGSRS